MNNILTFNRETYMKRLQRQKGFTLVELAIVLTIVGLLIGGILKGQQLIANARVTAQMAQFHAIEAATTTFQDTYQGLPGDLANAGTTGPGYTQTTCTNGLGAGLVGAYTAVPTAPAACGGATVAAADTKFFEMLASAGLISGVATQAAQAVLLLPGDSLPIAKINGTALLSVNELAPAAPAQTGL